MPMGINCCPPKAVLFDFDGTLTLPGALNFAEIRRTLGCPLDKPILEYIADLSDNRQQRRLLDMLEAFEMQGAEKSVPNPGAEHVVQALRARGIAVGILSRNGIEPIRKAFQHFNGICSLDFDVIISRNDPYAPKPSPQGIHAAAAQWGIRPWEMMVVGDYIFDIQAGKNAGAVTVFLKNPGVVQNFVVESDFTIASLVELLAIIN